MNLFSLLGVITMSALSMRAPSTPRRNQAFGEQDVVQRGTYSRSWELHRVLNYNFFTYWENTNTDFVSGDWYVGASFFTFGDYEYQVRHDFIGNTSYSDSSISFDGYYDELRLGGYHYAIVEACKMDLIDSEGTYSADNIKITSILRKYYVGKEILNYDWYNAAISQSQATFGYYVSINDPFLAERNAQNYIYYGGVFNTEYSTSDFVSTNLDSRSFGFNLSFFYEKYAKSSFDYSPGRGDVLAYYEFPFAVMTTYDFFYYISSSISEIYFKMDLMLYGEDLNTFVDEEIEGADESNYDRYYDEGYQDGLSDGQGLGYQDGYAKALDDLAQVNTTAVTIFSGILDIGMIPINAFLTMLNFEVFGINIGGFVTGLFTIAIVVVVTRLILGGKND